MNKYRYRISEPLYREVALKDGAEDVLPVIWASGSAAGHSLEVQIWTEKWKMVWLHGQDPRRKISRPQKWQSGKEAFGNGDAMTVTLMRRY